MAGSKSQAGARSARAWTLASQQHGILTRRDLLALGFTAAAIEHRVAQGRLHLVTRGVYAVGWPRLTRERRWMAAVLACGPSAALSHRSAAALWGIAEEGSQIDISVRRSCKRRRAGIHTRRRPSLPAEEIVLWNGIPVTCPTRTLLDLATELSPAALERAVNEADKRDLVDPETLRASLSGFAGQPGVRPLRALLHRHTFRLSDSDLERFFRPIAAAAGLPTPLTKAQVNGFEVDFFWPDLGLVVETDGLRYHRTPSAQARDRLRDQTHTAAGLTPLRFTHYQVKYESAHVQKVLSTTAQNLTAWLFDPARAR
ncbi:MAG: type IV toxin-antitoxin system AbiEi family antitoxin domain-containing protein [Solirubrobacterales bacterium]